MRIFKIYPLFTLIYGYLKDSPESSNITLYKVMSMLGILLLTYILTSIAIFFSFPDPQGSIYYLLFNISIYILEYLRFLGVLGATLLIIYAYFASKIKDFHYTPYSRLMLSLIFVFSWSISDLLSCLEPSILLISTRIFGFYVWVNIFNFNNKKASLNECLLLYLISFAVFFCAAGIVIFSLWWIGLISFTIPWLEFSILNIVPQSELDSTWEMAKAQIIDNMKAQGRVPLGIRANGSPIWRFVPFDPALKSAIDDTIGQRLGGNKELYSRMLKEFKILLIPEL